MATRKKLEISKEAEVIEVSEESFVPWSFSKWKVFSRCPLQGYLKHILKVKVPFVAAPETLVGKAAHLVLEYMISGKTLQEALTLAKPQYQSQIDWEKEIVNGLTTQFLDFGSRFESFKRLHPIKRIYQEVRVAVTKEWRPTTFFGEDCYYRGVIDLAMHLQNNDLITIDHKTGAPAVMGLRNFQKQLDVYKVLFHYGISPIAGASSGIHFIRDSEIKIGDYTGSSAIPDLRKAVEFDISSLLDTLEREGQFKKIPGSYCAYCDYREDCKAGLLDSHVQRPLKLTRKKNV